MRQAVFVAVVALVLTWGYTVADEDWTQSQWGPDDEIGSANYLSRDPGTHFERLDSPMNALPVWKGVLDSVYPDILFAGTRAAARD
jgi:hypothetical protein